MSQSLWSSDRRPLFQVPKLNKIEFGTFPHLFKSVQFLTNKCHMTKFASKKDSTLVNISVHKFCVVRKEWSVGNIGILTQVKLENWASDLFYRLFCLLTSLVLHTFTKIQLEFVIMVDNLSSLHNEISNYITIIRNMIGIYDSGAEVQIQM